MSQRHKGPYTLWLRGLNYTWVRAVVNVKTLHDCWTVARDADDLDELTGVAIIGEDTMTTHFGPSMKKSLASVEDRG